ncbi:hypothetical protein EDD58_10830 [Hazenella coriacea]|uniref:Uncharacterized protein n=1 Tax=Hazenella coriacea TaxID=1179467 RepID=A0A4R3L6V1_9BACL|nr:hypothetical protein EDD58_10830 [Hazenella coriacea]
MFVLRIKALDVENGAHIPLNSWYEKFVDMEPLPIDHL